MPLPCESKDPYRTDTRPKAQRYGSELPLDPILLLILACLLLILAFHGDTLSPGCQPLAGPSQCHAMLRHDMQMDMDRAHAVGRNGTTRSKKQLRSGAPLSTPMTDTSTPFTDTSTALTDTSTVCPRFVHSGLVVRRIVQENFVERRAKAHGCPLETAKTCVVA